MDVVYKIECNDCNATYIGKINAETQDQISDHNHINRNNTMTKSVITELQPPIQLEKKLLAQKNF